MREMSRRDFFKMFGAGVLDKKKSSADEAEAVQTATGDGGLLNYEAGPLKTGKAKETASMCTFCGCGCGIIVSSIGDRVVHIEGDPDNPYNEGSIYCKGVSLGDTDKIVDYNSLKPKFYEKRITEVLYRAPGSDRWETKNWAWASERIAESVKKVRDETFELTDEFGATVNRTKAIAFVGGSSAYNEEYYIIHKMMRALGVVYLDSGAGLPSFSPGEEPTRTFERSLQTNGLPDYKNSDVFLLIGSNPAGNLAQITRFIRIAVESGDAKVIAVDVRDNEAAAKADIYAEILPGTDLPFIYGLINYALENGLYSRDYLINYTNAPFLVNPEYNFEDGAFSGLTEKNGDNTYDTSTWQYQKSGRDILKDLTLDNPDCVFQILRKLTSAYGLEEVSAITGVSVETYRKICELYCSTGKPDKAGNLIYAMEIDQHTYGSQELRAAADLQRLLGNTGAAGGGISVPQRESNVQGVSDMGIHSHCLPGYINSVNACTHRNFKEYLERETPDNGYWSNKPKFLISMLKAWYGANATADNKFCFEYLPKRELGNRSFEAIAGAMRSGGIKGLFAWGQNLQADGPMTQPVYEALENLDWMVAVDRSDAGAASFWKRPETNPANIKTEVFLLPAALSFEKEGSATNNSRRIQWSHKAVEPPGQARSDLHIAYSLMDKIREKYSGGGVFPGPILDLIWNYSNDGSKNEPDIEKVATEINGYEAISGKLLSSYADMKDDGSTACGVWLYCGYYFEDPEQGQPACKRRSREDEDGLGLYRKWSFTWPLNRHIAYDPCYFEI